MCYMQLAWYKNSSALGICLVNNKCKPFIDTGAVVALVLKCNIFQPKKP